MASPTQKDTQSVAPKETEQQFSLIVKGEMRLQVLASTETEAREIVEAILGNGRWQRNSDIGVPFALRVKW